MNVRFWLFLLTAILQAANGALALSRGSTWLGIACLAMAAAFAALAVRYLGD